ncbi:hypothetical protein [Parasphingopyxis lamellibrachiae]|nr:hypothetical protein [Parasphingopyxis lamellibrachiae]
MRAHIFYLREKFDQAERALDRDLKEVPQWLVAEALLATVYVRQDRDEEAWNLFKRIILDLENLAQRTAREEYVRLYSRSYIEWLAGNDSDEYIAKAAHCEVDRWVRGFLPLRDGYFWEFADGKKRLEFIEFNQIG